MRCARCSQEVPADAAFCPRCGAALEGLCAHCGTPNAPDHAFCKRCGRPLDQRAPTATPASFASPRAYTPRHLAEKILTARSALEGERRQVTVLFADVANFTTLAEQLDPEIVHEIMDGCFERITAEVHRFEGSINQYTGDGVMALFGAPIAHEDGPRRAVHAALGIQRALREYGQALQAERGLTLQMRIGINTGPVVVGKIGDDLRMDYTPWEIPPIWPRACSSWRGRGAWWSARPPTGWWRVSSRLWTWGRYRCGGGPPRGPSRYCARAAAGPPWMWRSSAASPR